ncbi:MAG: UbiA prenyltransferase family protein [Microgenomates group bacterium]
MVQLFFHIFQSLRPRQALKNLSLLAPLVFSGNLFVEEKFLLSFLGVITFTFLTSACYIINDIIDLPRDQLHPIKKKRPIASGILPLPIAFFIAVCFLFTSFWLGLWLNFFFFLILIIYFFLQLAYSFYFKNIIVLDVLIIATGFVLRVYAGAFLINVHMNVWFLLCVVSLALFLAVGKRRAELAVLDLEKAGVHRKTLIFYTPQLLDVYLAMFANSAWLSYALFTFFSPPPPISQQFALYRFLPLALSGINKWLMITIPLVIYGVMRYMSIIYQGNKAEAPEKILLSDRPLLTTVLIWGLMVVAILYGIKP